MVIKTGKNLAAACLDVANNHKTLYVLGCIGAPMTSANRDRYSSNLSYNRQAERLAKIKAATADTFGFDCVCLIKSLLWGWDADTGHVYGGSDYASNDVPDIDANQMIRVCSDVSTNFSNIQIGEAVWMEGHIGVYIGDGLAVECTPRWDDGVQITAVHNIGKKAGYNGRSWTKHGKLPYVTYEAAPAEKPVSKEEVCNVQIKQIKKGSKGSTVKALQILLKGYGYSVGSSGADGIFGAATEAAVKAFQKDMGLVSDGIVGPATWKKLLGAS